MTPAVFMGGGSPRGRRAAVCAGFLGILLIAGILRFWRIGDVPFPVFDEIYYATMAAEYLDGTPFIDAHPPAARFAFASLAWLGGATGKERFPENDVPYGAFPYRLLRGGSAVAGTLLVAFLMLLVRERTGSWAAGLVAGTLAAFENGLVVESRYILGDVFVLLFGIAGLWCFLRKDREPLCGGKWYGFLALASILFGLSVGSKVSGAVFLLVAGFAAFERRKKDRVSPHVWGAFLFGVPALVVFSLFMLHFAILRPTGPVFNVIAPASGIADDAKSTIDVFENFRESRALREIYELWGIVPGRITQIAMESVFAGLYSFLAHFHDPKPHLSSSPWYSWPFMVRPVRFFLDVHDEPKRVIAFFGNPLLWWGGLAAALLIALRRVTKKEFREADVFLFGFAVNLLLAVSAPRELFLHHYLPSFIFLIPLAALALVRFAGRNPTAASAFLLATVASFFFFAPFTYGTPLSEAAREARAWFPSWRLW